MVKLACKVVLDRDELESSLQSFGIVLGAASERIKSLTGGRLHSS